MMKTISKFFLGFALSAAANTAFANPPAAICLNMPLTITPLNGGDVTVKKRLLPLCFETKDFVLDSSGKYRPQKPFIRVYGNGGFSENVAWHNGAYVDGKNPNRFAFTKLSGVWESILASFLSSALREEGFVSLAVGSLPGAFANTRCIDETTGACGLLSFGGRGPESDPVAAIGYHRSGVKFDLLIEPERRQWGYSVSRVEQ